LRSQTLRLGIFICTLIVGAIIIFQLIWLKKVYYFEQKQFDHSIAKALRGFYEDINEPVDPKYNLNQMVVNSNNEVYFARITQPLSVDSVLFYMQDELEGEDIFTDCYLGLYNAAKKQYAVKSLLVSATDSQKQLDSLPVAGLNYDHITLYFPHRRQYILSLMNFWTITSLLLLVVLILFGGSVYYFYRQRFLNELQKDFVNNFTHEFKTPVSVLNLAAEVLEKPDIAQKPERLSKYAAIVKYQGKYLQDQIERLLRQAYSESNNLQLHKKNVNLHHLIEEAVNNLQPLIEEKKASIQFEFEATESELLADHGYLLIVVTNLVENALKYSKDPRVIIHTENDDNEIILSVKDNGRGIDKKYFHKIFRKFYRVPNGEQIAARGFGLGLSFSKRIVEAHHGKIKVESIPGIGSNFIITVPVLHL
jgi:two-component system phosphate regulon sensor histidine kinase PhoR